MADNRPIAYVERGDPDRTVFRASSAGRPTRCLASALKGFTALPAPAYLVKAAEAGNMFEEIVKRRLRENGWTVGDTQVELDIRVQEDPMIVVRGHLDAGYVSHDGPVTFDWIHSVVPMDGPVDIADGAMLEVKSMSSRVWAEWRQHRFDRFPEYAYQISTYMHGRGQPAVYAVVNRDTEELELGYLTTPPVPWDVIRAHILLANYWGATSEELPGCTGAKYPCAYDYLCDRKAVLLEEVESGSDSVLERLASDYAEARNMEAEVAAQKEALRSEILEAMGDRSKVQTGRWSVAVSQYETTSLDRKALDAFLLTNGKRLADFQTKKSATRLNVTEEVDD